MPTLMIEYADDTERLALEQAIAFVTERRQLAATAPESTVLAACEQAALHQGRALLRHVLAAAVPSRSDNDSLPRTTLFSLPGLWSFP
ncbi:MAG TPA: hypothetical protein VNK04_10210 [Gemmataceae bacterium]|nr:hypothetical protein [Gemmataceae bacterium]